MVDATYEPKVYKDQNGDRQVVKSGGEIKVEPGGTITNDGVQAAAVADFTGASGGTANGALVDTSTATTATDGTTPGAAALKTDVDARLVSIADNIEELASDLEAIKAALRGAGIIAS